MILRIKEHWRKWRTRQRLLNELQPKAVKQLAEEVNSLSLCAAMTCPDDLSLQCVQQTFQSLRARAVSPALANEPEQIRLQLRQGIIQSRQQLIHSLQGSAEPTRFMQ